MYVCTNVMKSHICTRTLVFTIYIIKKLKSIFQVRPLQTFNQTVQNEDSLNRIYSSVLKVRKNYEWRAWHNEKYFSNMESKRIKYKNWI